MSGEAFSVADVEQERTDVICTSGAVPCAQSDSFVADTAREADTVASIEADAERPVSAKDVEDCVRMLSQLPPIEREVRRAAEAARLNIRLSFLDEQISQLLGGQEATKQGKAIEFEEIEPWPQQVDGAGLLDEIAGIFRRYVSLPQNAEIALALWTVFSYCFEEGDVAPILLINSPVKRCGKTTTLSVLNRLCSKPLPASNITAAALFRTVEAYKPTLLIDEADSFLREKEELRGVINSGHTRATASVLRVVGDDSEPRAFSTWCPKVIAGIGKMQDTIEDRAIIITLQRKLPHEVFARLRARDDFPDTRRRIARWRRDHLEELKQVRLDPPPFLNDRAADNWEPLLTIAHLCGGSWLNLALEACRPKEVAPGSEGLAVELLRDIRTIFDKRDRMPSVELLAALTCDPEKAWATCRNGAPLDARQLAQLLRGFRIASQTIRLQSNETPKGYKRQQFEDAWSRYLPDGADGAATTPQAM